MASRSDVARAFGLAAAAGATLLLARAAVKRRYEYDFRNKVVLITGGSRGLGLVLGRQLAELGAKLVICARDGGELQAARQDLERHGARVLATECDLRDPDDVQRMVEGAIAHFGAIDVLINNAGTIMVGPVESMTLEDYREQMDSNYWSAVHTCYHVVPHMQQRRQGRIVNISSIGGKMAVPHLVPYCAGKFAVTGFSRGLRAELMKDGIVVTTVCPGLMRTGSPRNAMFKSQHQAEYAWFSISDSLPVVSMSAEHAARDIIAAASRGEVEIVLSIPAKIASVFDQLFPEYSSELMSLAGRMMPALGGIGRMAMRGADSQSVASPSILTTMTEEAALRNNEVPQQS